MRAEEMGHLKVSNDPTGNDIKMKCFSKRFTTYHYFIITFYYFTQYCEKEF